MAQTATASATVFRVVYSNRVKERGSDNINAPTIHSAACQGVVRAS